MHPIIGLRNAKDDGKDKKRHTQDGTDSVDGLQSVESGKHVLLIKFSQFVVRKLFLGLACFACIVV